MKRKAFLIVALLLVGILVIAGCSNSDNNTSNTNDNSNSTVNNQSSDNSTSKNNSSNNNTVSDEPPEPVEIDFWFRQGGKFLEVAEQFTANFMEEYPHITVNFDRMTYDNYITALQTAIASENVPDVFTSIPNIPLKLLVEQDVVRPIDDWMSDEMKADFIDGTWTEGETVLDGKTYAVPGYDQRNHSPAVVYNKDLLANAGYTEVPRNPSFDEFIEMAKAVEEANPGKHGATFAGAGWIPGSIFEPVSNSVNPDIAVLRSPFSLFNYKTGEPEYNTGLVESLEFFKRMQDEGILHPDTMLFNPTEARAPFWDGQVGFIFEVSSNVQVYPRDVDNFGVVFAPSKDGNMVYKGNEGVLNNGIMFSKHSENQEAMKLFFDYFVENYGKMLGEAGINTPATKSQAAAFESDWELFNDAMALRDDSWILVPNPVKQNKKTIDVAVEATSNMPTIGTLDIFTGYMSGQITDLQAELDSYDKQMDQTFFDALEAVDGVDQSDYIFPDWVPGQPYE